MAPLRQWGHGMSFLYLRKPLRYAIAAAALLAAGIAVSPKAEAAGAAGAIERALYVAVGETARAPIGWIEFCVENTRECATHKTSPRDIVMSNQTWTSLVRINDWVNQSIKPITDMDHWGVVEKWSYPDDGYGDCEDYVCSSAAC